METWRPRGQTTKRIGIVVSLSFSPARMHHATFRTGNPSRHANSRHWIVPPGDDQSNPAELQPANPPRVRGFAARHAAHVVHEPDWPANWQRAIAVGLRLERAGRLGSRNA